MPDWAQAVTVLWVICAVLVWWLLHDIAGIGVRTVLALGGPFTLIGILVAFFVMGAD